MLLNKFVIKYIEFFFINLRCIYYLFVKYKFNRFEIFNDFIDKYILRYLGCK